MPELLNSLWVFMLAGFIGFEVIRRVSPLLHETILALFDGRNDRDRTTLLIRLAMLELHQAEDSATFIPLPKDARCRRAAELGLADPAGAH